MNYQESPKHRKIDNFFVGFVPAIIIPFILIVLITSQNQPGNYTLYENIVRAFNNYAFGKIAIMAMMPNLILFFWVYKLELWKLNAGLISATLLFLAFVFFILQSN